jgi:hypothetical protein
MKDYKKVIEYLPIKYIHNVNHNKKRNTYTFKDKKISSHIMSCSDTSFTNSEIIKCIIFFN